MVSWFRATACSESAPWSVRVRTTSACVRSQIDGLRVGDAMAVHGDKKRKTTGRELVEGEAAIRLGDRRSFMP